MTISIREGGNYARRCEPFQAGGRLFRERNLRGEHERTCDGCDVYVVYSYATPIYVYTEGRWFANRRKYSHSTGRHQRACAPHCEVQDVSEEVIRSIVEYGLAGHVAQVVRQAVAA